MCPVGGLVGLFIRVQWTPVRIFGLLFVSLVLAENHKRCASGSLPLEKNYRIRDVLLTLHLENACTMRRPLWLVQVQIQIESVKELYPIGQILSAAFGFFDQEVLIALHSAFSMLRY